MTTEAPQLTDHEKAMIAKANESTQVVDDGITAGIEKVDTNTNINEPAVRPEWCPEEFWNADTGVANTEALAKKYAELAAEKAKPVEKTAEQIAEEAEAAKNAPVDPPFVAAVEAANKDIEKDGKLTEETYKGFEKLGLSREHVDAYIEGQQAKAELVKMRVFGEAGSEENFTRMFEWGVQNYTEAEREMFDKMMNSGNVEQALGATRALQARFEAAEGKEGKVTVPNGQSTSAATGYTSKDEVVAAMSKPEYRTNAKYRAEVQAKINAALQAGTDLGF